MSFAYIQEAWAPPGASNEKKKRRPPSTPEHFDQMDDKYLYTKRQPKANYRPAMIEESRGNVYDVTPQDINDLRPSNNFMDYDDFYKSDFQYTSSIDDSQNIFEPIQAPRQEAPPPLPMPRQEAMTPVSNLREPFMNNGYASTNMTREQMYLELVLYTVTGIFLILILEQFLQLGSKIA